MLTGLFTTLLEISISTSIVILVLKLLSTFLNKNYASKWKYWIWLILAVRLMIPVNFSLPVAPVDVTIPNVTFSNVATLAPVFASPAQQKTINSVTNTAQNPITLIKFAMLLWAIGCIAYFLYHFIGFLVFKRQALRWSQPAKGHRISHYMDTLSAEIGIKKQAIALISDEVSSPLMMGFIHPVLLLPNEAYSDTELSFILKHELTHYKRHDLWYKLFLVVVNAVHWFNPIVYLLRCEANGDLELSCDDEVLKGTDFDERKAYSETILTSIHNQKMRQTALSTYFHGGTKTMKERFKNILNTKERHSGLIMTFTILLSVAIIGTMIALTFEKTPTSVVTTPTVGNIERPKNVLNNDNSSLGVEPVDDLNQLDDTPATITPKKHSTNTKKTVDTLIVERFKETAKNFAIAYFSNDEAGMKEYLNSNVKVNTYGKNVFNNLEKFTLKYSPEKLTEGNTIYPQYEYILNGEDSYSYLGMEMKYTAGRWIIYSYYLEK
jgi:beta-lactamase regulating signal transducer with metallopeptidase domain